MADQDSPVVDPFGAAGLQSRKAGVKPVEPNGYAGNSGGSVWAARTVSLQEGAWLPAGVPSRVPRNGDDVLLPDAGARPGRSAAISSTFARAATRWRWRFRSTGRSFLRPASRRFKLGIPPGGRRLSAGLPRGLARLARTRAPPSKRPTRGSRDRRARVEVSTPRSCSVRWSLTPACSAPPTDFLAANASYDIQFQLADVAYRGVLLRTDPWEFTYLLGARYAHLGQTFASTLSDSTSWRRSIRGSGSTAAASASGSTASGVSAVAAFRFTAPGWPVFWAGRFAAGSSSSRPPAPKLRWCSPAGRTIASSRSSTPSSAWVGPATAAACVSRRATCSADGSTRRQPKLHPLGPEPARPAAERHADVRRPERPHRIRLLEPIRKPGLGPFFEVPVRLWDCREAFVGRLPEHCLIAESSSRCPRPKSRSADLFTWVGTDNPGSLLGGRLTLGLFLDRLPSGDTLSSCAICRRITRPTARVMVLTQQYRAELRT